ncbi:AAA family ATPase [Accumulibacter sp.]|uniref:ParA family protein n=1 Tax=Accumulibacter sp. TaxID=2053492 RepID=UPI001D98E4F8|nr:AAA family ATPase [Accumulibacter sp.]MCB1968207.1 ParA family protein [Accumulibacter sp.]MCP5228612.1 ParA family protein [Accumulibacter sp.]
MSVPVLTFFNNKGGVGKTSLVFHLAWMLSEMGKRVVAIDLDPQANLTSAFLSEDDLEILWDPDDISQRNSTIYQCVRPLTEVGDILAPQTQRISSRLHLVPGDLGLAGFEDFLSREWPDALGSGSLYRPFRILSSFWQVAQMAAGQHGADIILADVGPNLGAINRSALIGTDHVVIPLAADLFSLQGLRNLGPTLQTWREDWKKRVDNWSTPAFALPAGSMEPVGYILMQHSERLSRPVKAYNKWADRIPLTYQQAVLGRRASLNSQPIDANRLAKLKHYRSLVPMAQEVRKPIFQLSTADGAIGSHSYAVRDARTDFEALAVAILERIGPVPETS